MIFYADFETRDRSSYEMLEIVVSRLSDGLLPDCRLSLSL